jgi:hypothetical protein
MNKIIINERKKLRKKEIWRKYRGKERRKEKRKSEGKKISNMGQKRI